jgi:hypothetical protein
MPTFLTREDWLAWLCERTGTDKPARSTAKRSEVRATYGGVTYSLTDWYRSRPTASTVGKERLGGHRLNRA